jgi:hypothetical protein
LVSGAAGALAALVTPTRGVLTIAAATTAFLDLRRNRLPLAAFAFAIAVPALATITYLAMEHALVAAFQDVILFTASRYASIQAVRFGIWASYQNLPVVCLFPITALLALLVCLKDWRAFIADGQVRLSLAFTIAGFIGCFPRPDATHIGFSAPLACPLFAYSLHRLFEAFRPLFRGLIAAGLIVLWTAAAYSFALVASEALHEKIVTTSRGDIKLIRQPGTQEFLARIEATPAEDAYFFYPYMPLAIFLTERKHVSKNDIFIPGYTLLTQYWEACRSAMQEAAWAAIDRRWQDPNLLKGLFPGITDARPPETVKFERSLVSGFKFVAGEDSFSLWRRGENADPALCILK